MTPKIKGISYSLCLVLHWATSWLLYLLLTASLLSSRQIQVLRVHYCNTAQLKMQNALNTIKLQKISHQCIQLKKRRRKKKVIKFAPSSQSSVSDMSGPRSHPRPFPLEKVQIFTFLIPLKM